MSSPTLSLRRVSLAVLATALVAVLGAGCGSQTVATTVSGTASPLPRSAVPYLASRTQPLTAADLLEDGPQPGLQDDLARWKFLGGAQRTFQGHSHKLQLVVSRTLMFGTPGGAREYVQYVKQHAADVIGSSPTIAPLQSQDRAGWMITPAGCACHMAQPALVGLVSRGPRVSWLEVNGPQATAAALKALLDQAP